MQQLLAFILLHKVVAAAAGQQREAGIRIGIRRNAANEEETFPKKHLTEKSDRSPGDPPLLLGLPVRKTLQKLSRFYRQPSPRAMAF